MAKFFNSPADLAAWIRDNNASDHEAATRILNVVDSSQHEQDIWESCRRIMTGKDVEGASGILFKILAQYEITEARVAEVESKMKQIYAANELHRNGRITTAKRDSMVKKAQVMRQPGQYNEMPLRICPKLPKQSAGKGIISTYNCRHYCLDSLVFDDDPLRVYCAEAMWRRHVADKFSQEWKDTKTGNWVGGYINQRFHCFPDAGTPDNQDVPLDHGNKMQLKPGERTRQPRPHQWSVERRMQEAREKGSTESIVLAQAPRDKMIKLASTNVDPESAIYKAYSLAVELENRKVSQADAALMMEKRCGVSLGQAVKIQTMALKKMIKHQADVYISAPTVTADLKKKSLNKQAGSTGRVQTRKKPSACPKCGCKRLNKHKDWGGQHFGIYNCTDCGEAVSTVNITPQKDSWADKQKKSREAKPSVSSPSVSTGDDIQEGALETGLTEKKKPSIQVGLPR